MSTKYEIFNNPKVFSRSWYAVYPAWKLRGSTKSIHFCDYKVALFRDENGVASALYAYCPHMGADLGKGKVVGNSVVCPYHQWSFNGSGTCTKVTGKNIKAKNTFSFPVVEKYGLIWIFNGEKADYPFPELKWSEEEYSVFNFPTTVLKCHHHVVGTNNPDFNHLESLHEFKLENKPEQNLETPYKLTYKYQVEIKPQNLFDRIFSLWAGKIYEFDIFQHGSSNIMMDIKSKRYHLRTLITLCPTAEGHTISRFTLFVPKWFSWLRLPILLASVLRIQLQDLTIYNNIDYVLPENEPSLVRHKDFIESLGVFHPKA